MLSIKYCGITLTWAFNMVASQTSMRGELWWENLFLSLKPFAIGMVDKGPCKWLYAQTQEQTEYIDNNMGRTVKPPLILSKSRWTTGSKSHIQENCLLEGLQSYSIDILELDRCHEATHYACRVTHLALLCGPHGYWMLQTMAKILYILTNMKDTLVK